MTGATTPHLFCFGLGYSARALADSLSAKGWKISGTCRSADKARALDAAGFDAHLFDGSAPLAIGGRAALKAASHILISVPPAGAGDPALHWHGAEIAAFRHLQWLGYLSTTGVYGDKRGAWVDENTPPAPTSKRGEWRLKAEQGWLALFNSHATPVHIFRLAGIYGPGSNQLESLLAGKARRIIKQAQVFSRIHRDDIVKILIASMARPNPGAVYNLCDDEAAPPQDVISFAAGLLKQPEPPAIAIEAAELSPMAASFYSENKRVKNNRIKQELGVRLSYPTYREGLQALYQAILKR